MKLFKSNFYFKYYIQHNITEFFNIISSYIVTIYEKWAVWVNAKLHLNN